MQRPSRKKIGLALGSGGARGLAHIGAIKVLLDNGIPIDLIAGTSAGALIGGLYAATEDIDFVERVALSSDRERLMHFVFDISSGGGLLSGTRVEEFIAEQLDRITFDGLKLPFIALATDLQTGERIAIDTGDVAAAIRASISVPFVFEPVRRDGRILVDGGLSEPIPIDTVRAMGADTIIAVNLDAPCEHDADCSDVNFKTIADCTMNILRHHLSVMHAKDADVLVEPQFVHKDVIGWEDFLRAQDLIDRGAAATEAVLPKLKRMLQEDSRADTL